jgi:hypothetical protein
MGHQVQEFRKRDGLPNFYRKTALADTLRVAYLGGSITAQPGWRVLSLAWMKKRFPRASFREVNAAVGGTGSDFGVFRLEDDVLKFHPDLVMVEFAVNDDGAAAQKVIRSMEGIVRRIWQENPLTDICFVYTIKQDFLSTELEGKLPASALAMERVADYYHIPSINFGSAVCQLVRTGQLVFKGASRQQNGVPVFSPDGVHPYPATGHLIYEGVLEKCFNSMNPPGRPRAKKHVPGEPLAQDYFSHTQMVGLSRLTLSPGWQIAAASGIPELTGWGRSNVIVGRAERSGETVAIHFKGQAIGAYDLIGPGSGRVTVQVDADKADTIRRFDAYCTYWRPSYFLIDHLKDTTHVVVFKTLAEPFDKAGILAGRSNVIRDTAAFQPHNWYLVKILVDGKLE